MTLGTKRQPAVDGGALFCEPTDVIINSENLKNLLCENRKYFFRIIVDKSEDRIKTNFPKVKFCRTGAPTQPPIFNRLGSKIRILSSEECVARSVNIIIGG